MNLLFWELLLSLLLVLEEVCIFERIISSPKFLDIFLLEVPSNTVEIGKGGRATGRLLSPNRLSFPEELKRRHKGVICISINTFSP